jgi:nitrogen fixation protein NifQ
MMLVASQVQGTREQAFTRNKSVPSTNPNRNWLAYMIASWSVGQGVLPDYLGLEAEQFYALNELFFPCCKLPTQAQSGSKLDFSRMLEKADLVNLLKQYSRRNTIESDWMIGILVAGCLGSDHLWQDLGLWSRPQLSAMLQYNFPELAAKNDKDMKWKKFLYKQLCEAEGLYLCRAPSCEVCVDYPKCFGPEH